MFRKKKVFLSKRERLEHDIKYNKSLFLMLLIPMIILIVFYYIPIYGIQIAFKDYNPLQSMWSAKWVGLKYFKDFLNYYKFKELLINTMALNLYDLLLTPIPLIFALSLNYFPCKKFRSIVEMVSIMPHFISIVVICSLAMRFLSVGGIVNELTTLWGKEPENYLLRGEFFRSIYVWTGVWQNTGFSAIVYISALGEVSKEQHEAATLDGAGILQKIIYIDLPSVLPLFGVNLMFKAGAMLSNNYEKILLLQNNLNKQYSQVISTYTYEVAFEGMIPQYSLAMAIGLLTSIINIAMLMSVKKLTRGWEHLDE